MYYWALKTAAEVKYFEKIVLYTEVEEAWARAKRLSDRFVIVPRKIEECREPEWIVTDDLKRPNSRRSVYSDGLDKQDGREQTEFIGRVTGIEHPVVVALSADHPLSRSKSIERLIECYFEHDSAEVAKIVERIPGYVFTQNLVHPEFLWPVWWSPDAERQNQPPLYRSTGTLIVTYQNTGRRRPVFVEVPFKEGIDVHNKEDLELAKFYMEKRFKKK